MAGTNWLAKSFAQMTGENLGLIKSPFSFATRMEWYRHDNVNGGPFDTNGSTIDQPVAEMSIQEKLALILKAVDAFPHNARRTAATNGSLKKQCHSRASTTLKFCREFTIEWRTASTAAGRTNPLGATQTEFANPAQVVFGQGTGTESTVVRIDKTDGGLDPTHDDFGFWIADGGLRRVNQMTSANATSRAGIAAHGNSDLPAVVNTQPA